MIHRALFENPGKSSVDSWTPLPSRLLAMRWKIEGFASSDDRRPKKPGARATPKTRSAHHPLPAQPFLSLAHLCKSQLWPGRSEPKLTKRIKSHAGRNHTGEITIRGRCAPKHRRKYRIIENLIALRKNFARLHEPAPFSRNSLAYASRQHQPAHDSGHGGYQLHVPVGSVIDDG